MDKKTLLLIGPYPDNSSNHIGGTTILFKNFIDFLANNSIPHAFISTTRYAGKGNQVLNSLRVICKALLKITGCKMLILNCNRKGFLYLAAPLFCFAWIFRVRFALRMFGDYVSEVMGDANPFHRFILLKILKNADLLFFETRKQVEYFKSYNNNTHWFPNCRIFPVQFRRKDYRKKFVFISQLKVAKGVKLIVDVFRELGPDYSIEMYGPILDPELAFVKDLPCYKGVVSFEKVYDILNEHDVVLLPTFKGEGYPGIIIEAYAMSVPVIVSRWNSIPEMVNEGISGLLIEPKSANALKEAILSIDKDKYRSLNEGAFEMSKKFQSAEIHRDVFSIIQQLINV